MKKILIYLSLTLSLLLLVNLFYILINKRNSNKDEQPAGAFTPQITEKTPFTNVNSLERVYLKASERNYPRNVQKITIVFQNDTEQEYDFGAAYVLEKLKDGQWYQLTAISSGWLDFAYILKPNSQRKVDINLEGLYGSDYTSGRYRIIKDITNARKPGDYDKFYLAAEFDILDK